MDLKSLIRSIPDYPHEGIMFRDITTLFADARGFRRTVDELIQPYTGREIDAVAGIEARGFILGGAMAHQLSVGFIPIRKKGKLPWKTIGMNYALEYGTDRVEIHEDAVEQGARVLVVDDLIATGGTTAAGIELLRRAGAEVVSCGFVIELPDLGGAAVLDKLNVPYHALIQFEGT
ncbi:MAG: adenine phosphoribosyltransferase [Rhodospirillales bacterium]|nr:adenine phosphoribosyltransferase [Rhodospirillales bacterium]